MPQVIRISLFGGIVPRLADRGLPDNAAQFALNAKLFSGELRSWNKLRTLKKLSTASGTTKRVFHYRHNGLDRYLTFTTDADVVKAPLLNEQLGRLYYTDTTGAHVTTTQRIEDGNPPFKLGVPPPGGTFTVTAVGGSSENAETRVYLATLVTAFGEESAPGTTVTVTGNADGTWTVNGLNALTVDTVNYPNITHLRLYRTITSGGGVDYRRVNEWTIGTRPASYVDNITSVDLADNPVLETLGWDLPPATLQGLIGVAGGFMAGFVGRTVRLSVPYFPHAWPEDYSFAVEDNIVGLGTFGNTVVVLTEGRPYLLVGMTPDAMSLQKMEGVQPCLAKRSITNTVAGVMYASTDGLVLIDGTANTGTIVSRNWVTKDEWLASFAPSSTLASVYQDRYFAFYSNSLGYTVGFDDPVTGWTELQQNGVVSVDLDTLTGQTLVTTIDPIGGGDLVCEWDSDTAMQLVYTWKSKPFLQNKPNNFGAIQLRGSFTGNSGGIPMPPAQAAGGYMINTQAINGGRRATLFPVGGVPYYAGSINGPPPWLVTAVAPFSETAGGVGVAVKVYGDGVLRWIGEISNESPLRLPSGYKATTWEIEVQGVAPIYSLTLADTMKALEFTP